MPILWKYLLRSYLQYLLLCVSGFIAVLLVIRFQEIAIFASSGAHGKYIFLFSLYQIPYILPIALPISCLISAMILFRKMSASLELIALRASGLRLRTIGYPLLWASCFFSLINFYIASELMPCTRILAKNLIYDVVRDNPLIVLQKEALIGIRAMSFDMRDLDIEKKAKDVLCVMKQPSSDRIALLTAKEVSLHDEHLHAKSLSLLTSAPSSLPGYDHLFLENEQEMSTKKEGLVAYLMNTEWFLQDDLLSFAYIVPKWLHTRGTESQKLFLEILRRLYLGLCPTTFTALGIAFGLSISRRQTRRSTYIASSLALLILLGFLVSKTLELVFITILFLSLLQPIAWLFSIRAITRIQRGIET